MNFAISDILKSGFIYEEDDVTFLPKIRDAARRRPASVNERGEDGVRTVCMRVSAPTFGPGLSPSRLCGVYCLQHL